MPHSYCGVHNCMAIIIIAIYKATGRNESIILKTFTFFNISN